MPNTNGPIEPTNTAGLKEGGRPVAVPPLPAVSPELSSRPERRTFSAAAKLRILEETDRDVDTGAIAAWYNQHRHHVGIGLRTPDQVHYGQNKIRPCSAPGRPGPGIPGKPGTSCTKRRCRRLAHADLDQPTRTTEINQA